MTDEPSRPGTASAPSPDADSGPGPGTRQAADGPDGGVSRRTLVKLLVGLGVGIPVVVELATFLGLVGGQLLGGSDGEPVGVGDELLPATPHSETVVDALYDAGTGRFTLTVEVSNGTEAAYDLRLGTVTTAAGERVDGGGSVTVPPGQTATLTGAWALPATDRPRRLAVTARTPDGTVERTVEFGTLPVRRS
jgi:hypothetical protein